MEEDIVGYFKQVERFDYITIDLEQQFFCIEVVNVKSNTTVLKISINLQKDETMVEGNIIHYDTFHIDALLQGLKCVARTCINHNLRNQKELFAFLEENYP
ncbi:protein Dhp61 [Bacillus fungorum]|uniref:protein Dhp61 n=1 Tax=Bacillus fungorum TaxID=2039284 RepID=UPI003F56271F